MAYIARLGIHVVPESGSFEPAEVFRLFDRWPGASMFAAPTMVKRLVEAGSDCDPNNIRTIIWGGAPMYVEDALRALDRFGPRLVQIYGQGESPMTIATLSKEDIGERGHPRWQARLASAGRPFACVEVIVADSDDRALPAGETGEILCRGDVVMAGYWQDPQASAATLRNGWLHTGDLGAFDADGYLTLKDRSKDVIISGGSNIYPREVEEVLLRLPRVREVSVVGRADREWGEVVVAYMVGDASAGELDRLCLDAIARFKRPKDYVFIDALPKNNYGKILKTELRAMDAKRISADRQYAQEAFFRLDAQHGERGPVLGHDWANLPLELVQRFDRACARKTRGARDGGVIGASAVHHGKPADGLVDAIVDHEVLQIGRRLRGFREQAAEIHAQRAVRVD